MDYCCLSSGNYNKLAGQLGPYYSNDVQPDVPEKTGYLDLEFLAILGQFTCLSSRGEVFILFLLRELDRCIWIGMISFPEWAAGIKILRYT